MPELGARQKLVGALEFEVMSVPQSTSVLWQDGTTSGNAKEVVNGTTVDYLKLAKEQTNAGRK
jgi:hypothetical protein